MTDRADAPVDRLPRWSLLRSAWDELRELVRYRSLVRYLVASGLRTQSTPTALGQLWWLLDPLLLGAVYFLLVDVIMRRGGDDFAVFVFASVVVWKHFQTSVRNATAITVSREQAMRQVRFPRSVLPLAATLTETVYFAFGLLVVIVAAIPFGIAPAPALALLPIVAAVQVVLALAIAFVLSALNVFFRDVQHLSGHAFRIWFYLSPGLYAVSLVPERLRTVYDLNPFVTLLPAYHTILLDGGAPDWSALAIVSAAATLLLLGAYALFVRLAPSFAFVT